jgi:uncharacterized protein YndB with AHSA1/START domain
MTAAAPQQPANATVTLSGDREVHIERIVNAPRDRVWKALTDPALIAQWWGRGNKLDIEKHEPVRGGHWRYVEHAHGETHGFEGRFAEVVPDSKIVSTFEWDGMPGHVALQTMMLEDLGDGRTRISSISLFHTGADRDGMVSSGMEGGMNESYRALDRVLASMS